MDNLCHLGSSYYFYWAAGHKWPKRSNEKTNNQRCYELEKDDMTNDDKQTNSPSVTCIVWTFPASFLKDPVALLERLSRGGSRVDEPRLSAPVGDISLWPHVLCSSRPPDWPGWAVHHCWPQTAVRGVIAPQFEDLLKINIEDWFCLFIFSKSNAIIQPRYIFQIIYLHLFSDQVAKYNFTTVRITGTKWLCFHFRKSFP